MSESKHRVIARRVGDVYIMHDSGPMDITLGDKIDIVDCNSDSVDATIMCTNNINAHKPIRRFEGCQGCWAYGHITSDLCDATGCSESSPVWNFIRVDNLLEEL